jgi:hypothetical protein
MRCFVLYIDKEREREREGGGGDDVEEEERERVKLGVGGGRGEEGSREGCDGGCCSFYSHRESDIRGEQWGWE